MGKEEYTCANCRYWMELPAGKPQDDDDSPFPVQCIPQGTGLCRFNPPRFIEGSVYGVWAKTNANDWCGRHHMRGGK